jgi:ribosomal protein S18 acetylase RimI-like enzyme
MDVTLRTVQDDDRPFLEALYASVRAAELEAVGWSEQQTAAFLSQQFDVQDRVYRSQLQDATLDIVLVEGEPAGRLYVDRRPDEIAVVDISLLPAHRARGVGTFLLEALQAEAAASGRALSLQVERANPAQRLYSRLGFELVQTGPVYLLMRWAPHERAAGAL